MFSSIAKASLRNSDQTLPKLMVTGCAGNVGRMMDSVFMSVFDYDLVGVDRSPDIQKKNFVREKIFGSEPNKLDIVYDQKEFGELLKTHGVEKVAHLASLSREEANLDYNLAKKYHIEGTKILIDQIKKNCDLSAMHIFYGSCMSVYGDRRANPEIRSTDEPKPMAHDYFALTKLEAENIIKDSGIPYTIFRYAPICDHLNWFVDLHPSFFYFGLDQKIEWITARDSAKAIRKGMFKSNEINKQIFNIGGGSKLVMRHREFMKEIFNARGVKIAKTMDLDPKAFSNINTFGGYYADSDYSNSVLGYRMQPIDTAYLRQTYRYPFPLRWLNNKLPVDMVAKQHYEQYSHIYQAIAQKDVEFLSKNYSEQSVLPREEVEKKLNEELEAEQDAKDLLKRQLAAIEKKHHQEFLEEKEKAEIRDAIEEKWRIKRQDLIEAGEDPDQINLDEVERLEAEEKLREAENGPKEEEKPKEKTEEEKIREKEIEEEEREREKKIFGY